MVWLLLDIAHFGKASDSGRFGKRGASWIDAGWPLYKRWFLPRKTAFRLSSDGTYPLRLERPALQASIEFPVEVVGKLELCSVKCLLTLKELQLTMFTAKLYIPDIARRRSH